MRTSVRAFRAVLHHHDNVPDVRMDERLESPPAAVGGPWSCRDYDGSKEARSSQLQAVTESYVVASTVCANYDQAAASVFFITSRCHRSQMKMSRYVVKAAVHHEGKVLDGDCECPA